MIRPERPSVAVAHRQSRGRGRQGSVWLNAPRAVAVSVGIRMQWDQSDWPLVPLVAGVVARRKLPGAVALKWPNDLLVGGSKVGGILTEAADGDVVVGMGLNLFWPDAPVGFGALMSLDPGEEAGPSLAIEWAEALLECLNGSAEDWPLQEYREGCTTLGQEITWEPDGRGIAVDIGPDGSLVVEVPPGERVSLRSGEVRHVRGT